MGEVVAMGPIEMPLACSPGVRDGPEPEKYWPQKSVSDAPGYIHGRPLLSCVAWVVCSAVNAITSPHQFH